MTLRELLNEGETKLKISEVSDARHDALEILLDTFHIGKEEYILYAETGINEAF